MIRLALALALAAGAPAAAQQAHRSTATGRWLADRLEGRELTAPVPTVPGIGTFTKTSGRFSGPGPAPVSVRTFTKEPGDFEGPIQILRVWNPHRITCVGNYKCKS